MPLDPTRRFPVMCLTQDGLRIAHAEQAARLCAAGARWIQLRMKGAARPAWLAEARSAAEVCRRHGAVLIVNDSVDVALESGADGVHLGSLDGDWLEARRALGLPVDRVIALLLRDAWTTRASARCASRRPRGTWRLFSGWRASAGLSGSWGQSRPG